jgi:TolB protein
VFLVDGTTSPVSVSGVESGRSVIVAGFNGADLDLQATASSGGGQSLFDYNPGTNTSTVLLGPPLNRGGVTKAVPPSRASDSRALDALSWRA